MAQHLLGLSLAFPSRYRIFRLVHGEVFSDDCSASSREKEIKAWRRVKKIHVIETQNRTGKT
ncbi:MAG TPA: hypothetical protein VNV41_09515 [Candidatus Acidoferrales bacterium]|nr:hypothetical protein [Candidatus Acidoferrales bacterium]